MENDEEQDCEVVLKNSELYNHLLSCKSEEFDVYDKSDYCNDEKQSNCVIRAPVTEVPQELLTFLDAILSSNILLDEDATYLYGFTVDLISHSKLKKRWRNVITAFLSVCSIAAVIKFTSSLSSDNFTDIFTRTINYYDRWRRDHSLKHLISIVKQIHIHLKKTSQILYEQNAYFKLQELKSKSNGQSDEFDMLLKKRRSEVDLLTSVLCQCIINSMHRTMGETRSLIHQLPLTHPVDSRDHYLAFMTDENLGLPSTIDSEESVPTLQSLERLKNIYLLMQSEYFRRLGLCFCPTLWLRSDSWTSLPSVFDSMKIYSDACENILSVIKFYYKKCILPDKLEENKPRDTVTMSGFAAIHKISTSLTETVTDSRILEEYVENLNSFNETEINSITNRLEELKINLNVCIKNIIFAEKYFFKLRPIGERHMKIEGEAVNSIPIDEPPKTDKIEQSNDRHPEDHVYFAITDGREESDEHQDRGDFEPVKLPNFILTELKEALICKRNEFNDRENKVIGNSHEYKKFIETPDTKDIRKSKYVHEPDNDSICDFQMYKMLASAVAQRSAGILNREEERFGSGDESDES